MVKIIKARNLIRIIGIILFLYILSKINLQELFQVLKNINLYYFLRALVLLPFSYFFGILKWKTLVNSQGLRPPFLRLTEIFLKGLFLGTVTPGRLGELWKAKYLREQSDISKGGALYSPVMERFIDLIIIIAVGSAGIISIFLFRQMGWLIVFLILILIIFLTYFLIRIFSPLFLRKKTNSFLDEFLKGLRELNFLLFLKLSLYGVLYYLTTVLIYYFLALSLGIEITFFNLFLIVALVLLLLILPVTILGLGTREAGYIFFFSIFNIGASAAVAFSSLVLLMGIILSIPGIILFLIK